MLAFYKMLILNIRQVTHFYAFSFLFTSLTQNTPCLWIMHLNRTLNNLNKKQMRININWYIQYEKVIATAETTLIVKVKKEI